MSRLLLLLVFLLWMSWAPAGAGPADHLISPRADLGLFLGVFVLLVLLMGLWSRLLARRVWAGNLYASLRRFNRSMGIARWVIPVWFGVGLFVLGWKELVLHALGPASRAPLETPSVLVGTLPAFLAWMGLWWSQYPADRALREQNLMIQLDQALPIHAPPGFRSYFSANLRLQLLFTIVPVLLILLAKDVASLALGPVLRGVPMAVRSAVENTVMFAAAAGVFLLAPEVLRRVLETRPLPDSSLRRRLESMCRRHGLRYRDILLWHTQGNLGNAAVMGVLPRFRYVLLSDLLLESMSDEQIEAVFAHEMGHIVHRHMLWYVVFVITLMFALAGPGTTLDLLLPAWAKGDVGSAVMMVAGVAAFLLVFGYLSRSFERQADVFAARTIERSEPVPAAGLPPSRTLPVRTHGASLFASALHRVAVVNNIPVAAPSWCHGSIAKRMRYLHEISADPARTRRFDAAMKWVYRSLVLTLLVTAGWTIYLIRIGM